MQDHRCHSQTLYCDDTVFDGHLSYFEWGYHPKANSKSLTVGHFILHGTTATLKVCRICFTCPICPGLLPINLHLDGAEFYSNSEFYVWSLGSVFPSGEAGYT